MLKLKRIYEPPAASDGYRVLVDRLWPRGVSKDKAAIDLWLKGIAPSAELRTWFGHNPELFREFTARYEHELERNPALAELRQLMKSHKDITLLYAAHDGSNNHAVVLKNYLGR